MCNCMGMCWCDSDDIKTESEVTKYMKALADERRDHAEKMHRIESTLIEYHEAYENIAEALGINIGHESWWDQSSDVQYKMIMKAIKLKA